VIELVLTTEAKD